ncbi:hypothetical protein [Lacticaseibacillus daqingensis]|uniref:hypothetical protein n=1 Tax=Lacticaseibacillus daqingensis TaxID=2486014 RepID=UPI0013DE0D0A|nr:hypothetical protein [Lacticaseibacillus daqingensis]
MQKKGTVSVYLGLAVLDTLLLLFRQHIPYSGLLLFLFPLAIIGYTLFLISRNG